MSNQLDPTIAGRDAETATKSPKSSGFASISYSFAASSRQFRSAPETISAMLEHHRDDFAQTRSIVYKLVKQCEGLVAQVDDSSQKYVPGRKRDEPILFSVIPNTLKLIEALNHELQITDQPHKRSYFRSTIDRLNNILDRLETTNTVDSICNQPEIYRRERKGLEIQVPIIKPALNEQGALDCEAIRNLALDSKIPLCLRVFAMANAKDLVFKDVLLRGDIDSIEPFAKLCREFANVAPGTASAWLKHAEFLESAPEVIALLDNKLFVRLAYSLRNDGYMPSYQYREWHDRDKGYDHLGRYYGIPKQIVIAEAGGLKNGTPSEDLLQKHGVRFEVGSYIDRFPGEWRAAAAEVGGENDRHAVFGLCLNEVKCKPNELRSDCTEEEVLKFGEALARQSKLIKEGEALLGFRVVVEPAMYEERYTSLAYFLIGPKVELSREDGLNNFHFDDQELTILRGMFDKLEGLRYFLDQTYLYQYADDMNANYYPLSRHNLMNAHSFA